MSEESGEVTRLLERWQAGDREAMETLLPILYQEIRKLAASYMRKERGGHTLQATDLVHEAFIRFTAGLNQKVVNRGQFLGLLARTMRRILVDHARRVNADKRIDPADRIALEHVGELGVGPATDILGIHRVIEDLSKVNPRHGKLVELRYFGGLTTSEIAEALEISEPTVARDWRIARLWLHRRLKTT